MPLTSPTGGTVDLIQELLITTPTNTVTFSPLDINRDKAYRLEYEILIDFSGGAGGWPSDIIPTANGLTSPNLQPESETCGTVPSCNGTFATIQFNGADYQFGTFTFRRFNVINRVGGFVEQGNYTTPASPVFEDACFGWYSFDGAVITNLTSLGVDFSSGGPVGGGIGIGSVFRLYKGSG